MADVFRITLRGKPSRTWYGKVRDPQTGRWDRWNTKATDKQVARKLLRERQARVERIAAGLEQDDSANMLDLHLSRFVRHIGQQGSNASYVGQTEVEILKVALACAGKKAPRRFEWARMADYRKMLSGVPLSVLTADRVDAFLASLPAKLSATTRNRYRISSVMFFNYLVERRVVPFNPLTRVVISKGTAKKRRRAATAEEIQRLLDAVRVRTPGPDGERRVLLYLTAFYSGLRKSELLSLARHHLRLDDNPTIHLPGEFTKNGSDAVLPIPEHLTGLLRSFVEGKPDEFHLFTEATKRDTLRELKRDLQRAGIPYLDSQGRCLDFHALRKSLGTALRVAGVDPAVSRLLMRHSDIRLTMSTYVDESMLDLRNAVAKLPIVK